MVQLWRYEIANVLRFTEGYLPSRETLVEHARKQIGKDAEIPVSSDEAAAWYMSSIPRRDRRLRKDWDGQPWKATTALPFDTWLIGPPHQEDAQFRNWFGGEPNATNYRLIIQRWPPWHEGQRVRPPTTHLDNALWKVGFRHRIAPYAGNIAGTMALLEAVGSGYTVGGAVQVCRLIEATGHSVAHSAGM